MKIYRSTFVPLLVLACMLFLPSCKKDNFKAPSSSLTGQLVYNGIPIGLEYNQVSFQVYQPGFGKTGAISGTFEPDGSYSLLLFDGNYKFTITPGRGPFRWKEKADGTRDTLAITLKGSQKLDIPVTPYYVITTPQITGASGTVSASFKVSQVITDVNARGIDRVSLYINRTQFVSGSDNIAGVDLAGSAITDPAAISMRIKVPPISPSQPYVYARIGLKVAGIQDLIFSPVVQVTY